MCRCAPSAKARTGSLRPHLRPTLSSMHPLAEQCTRRVPLQIKSAAPAAATMLGPSAATWRFMLPHRRATSMSLSFRRPPVRSVVRADLRAHCFRLRLHSKRCGGGRPPLSGIPCCLGYHAVCYCAIDTNPTAACPAGRYHECHDPSLESELGQVRPTDCAASPHWSLWPTLDRSAL